MRKNNIIIIAVILIFMVFMSSCRETGTESDISDANSENSEADTNNVEEYDDQEDVVISVTREYFENVDKNYRDTDIIEEIGAPSHIRGSGIIWLVWDLTDGTEASVCFSPYDDKIERIHIIAADESDELLYKRQHNNQLTPVSITNRRRLEGFMRRMVITYTVNVGEFYITRQDGGVFQ